MTLMTRSLNQVLMVTTRKIHQNLENGNAGAPARHPRGSPKNGNQKNPPNKVMIMMVIAGKIHQNLENGNAGAPARHPRGSPKNGIPKNPPNKVMIMMVMAVKIHHPAQSPRKN